MQKDKLNVLLSVNPYPGIIKGSVIAFNELTLVSWLLVLSLVFIQAMPVALKMLGSKGEYDYFIDEQMRLNLARKAGIEYKAYEIFDNNYHSIYKTMFHGAFEQRSKLINRLYQIKVNLRDARMEQMKNKFDEIQKRSNK
jgi:predicted ABC-type sugar transport system permease subunit